MIHTANFSDENKNWKGWSFKTEFERDDGFVPRWGPSPLLLKLCASVSELNEKSQHSNQNWQCQIYISMFRHLSKSTVTKSCFKVIYIFKMLCVSLPKLYITSPYMASDPGNKCEVMSSSKSCSIFQSVLPHNF